MIDAGNVEMFVASLDVRRSSRCKVLLTRSSHRPPIFGELPKRARAAENSIIPRKFFAGRLPGAAGRRGIDEGHDMRMTIVGSNPRAGGSECVVFGRLGLDHRFTPVS